jgi:predicted tellurium resistance membrane protein TerC
VHLQVFGVTLDPFIIYTSNMFAILSLRGLYTFVSGVMGQVGGCLRMGAGWAGAGQGVPGVCSC